MNSILNQVTKGSVIIYSGGGGGGGGGRGVGRFWLRPEKIDLMPS